MTVIDVNDIGPKLKSLLDKSVPGDEVVISDAGNTIARVLTTKTTEAKSEADANEQRKLEERREAARRVAGIWKDRDDLPDFAEMRKSWDRGYLQRE